VRYVLHTDGHTDGRDPVLQNLLDHIHRLPQDKAWSVEIKQYRKKRTLDQNARFHAMCSELGQTVGYTCEEMKRAVKHEIGAYEIVTSKVGKVARYESSADWDRLKMGTAIDLLHRWAIDCDHAWSVESSTGI